MPRERDTTGDRTAPKGAGIWVQKQQEQIDFINKQLSLEWKTETKFTKLSDAMREYNEIFGHELSPLPRESVLSNFYTPSNEQHNRELHSSP